MSTLSEVARRAGVTSATVSNVLRNRGRVGEQTRQRVLEAVEALNYRPHLAARALAEGRAPTIALMVSSIANPFYPEFALAVERAARTSGHFVIICNTNEDPHAGRAYLEQIAGTLSEGVLVMNANLDFDDLRKTEARGAPVVLCMWERPDDPPGLPCVAVDFRLAGQLAAQHLIELGHTRIGAVVGSKPSGIHASRYEGFVDAMREAGLKVPAKNVRYAPDTTQGGYTAARDLLEKDPKLTAIFATNDLPALGTIHAAADLGREVPRDLSVVGITDIQLAQQSRPPLTTVAVPTVEAAELAVSLLRELIERPSGKHGAHQKAPRVCVTSEPQLIVRGSTRKR
ncbi:MULTISPECIES: LacI family DNA-binding transcriptional regulator [Paraburkholderia]|jgi:DNA-binding LacI/PurR family transcriptional regulator|uniref:LacI family transcriptional regulator n=1 Tax=Paraburkholderia largidicola TaxID=3014751 RepID=A0A7I8BMH7_9BURK|nr:MULTISPECIES: LacI family DNA-binding transcriptional regulator [Paraburkholderia]BCF89459.1 LacI family transcriptional regulator [Paraburkholderia sp. PGU16]BEU22422.1 LacI family DNA-binding transcriptional regulator [Paraburkholderia sp. 22B1P]GJH06399.1 substrate-binding domain-containing protein [Paraburkholderia terrae]